MILWLKRWHARQLRKRRVLYTYAPNPNARSAVRQFGARPR